MTQQQKGAMSESLTPEGLLYLGLLSLQFGLQPLLFQRYMPADVDRKEVVFFVEIFKLFSSYCMLVLSGLAGPVLSTWSLRDAIRCAGAPSVVYAIQNLCIQISIQNMDPLAFNLLNQSKTIFVAVVLYFLMGRKQSFMQCIALLGLMGASAILSLTKTGAEDSDDKTISNSFLLGIVPCIVASLLSGLASGLSQVALQGENRNSFLFTMELSFFGAITTMAFSAAGVKAGQGADVPILHGWTMAAAIPVITNGLGGICVGLVMKHAGGVRKGFAIVTGIIITGFASYLVYDKPITMDTLIALPLVIFSSALHIYFPYVATKKSKST
eukprot:m.67304 g.67304  ORF g.67304 m.67304 type:complete len:327 (-) comp23793_c1_seq2:85-1065(-)